MIVDDEIVPRSLQLRCDRRNTDDLPAGVAALVAKLPPLSIQCPELVKEWHESKNEGLDPKTISAGSSQDAWWLCQKCGHEWKARISNRARKGRGCPKCAGTFVAPESSIAELYPELITEWHPTKNVGIDPRKLSPGSAQRVWWQCNDCSYEWESFVFGRTRNKHGCPQCAGTFASKQNNLADLFPLVAAEWHPTKNGDLTPSDVTGKSGQTVWWLCPTCLNAWQANVKNRTHLNSPCPLCSKDDAVLLAKKNKAEDAEDSLVDYSYDAEERVFLQHQEIQAIFKNFLKIEAAPKSIESLFSPRTLSRIDYEPYYQRNYVWDNVKATYFIESVLIGTEIPPLIFFESDSGSEVIDGRQRFETLVRFHNDKMALSPKGLQVLKGLANHTFTMLDEKLHNLFYDTTIRIITFAVVDDSRCDARLQDMLKKEVFRRYNSGITPLRRLDVERAVYINDDPTKYIKDQFRRNRNLYETFVRMFLAETDLGKLDEMDTREKAAQEARFLLVAAELPIMSARRKATLDQFYERFAEGVTDVQEVFKEYLKKLRVVFATEEYFNAKSEAANRYWYQVLFWGTAILAKERIDIEILKTPSWCEELLAFYHDKSVLFSPEESPFFYRQFYERFNAIAEFLGNAFKKNLGIYVRGTSRNLDDSAASTSANIEPTFLRIERQEPVPKSIDDICRMMLRGCAFFISESSWE